MTLPSDPLGAPVERQLGDPPLGGRLHPAAIGVWSIASLGPGILLLVVAGRSAIVPILFVGMSALAGVVRYLRFTWSVESGTLMIEQGLIERRRRVIPLDRIQSVEVVRGIRHRLFGVVELRVETVGASSSEGRLDALDPATAERVRLVLLRKGAEPDGRSTAADALASVSAWEIVVAGLTGGRVGVAAALFAFGQDVLGDRIERLFELDPTDDLRRTALVIAAVLIGAFLIGIVATVVTYWGFTVTRDGDSFRIQRGLLEQRTDTIPAARIQALWLEENLIRRLLGMAAVRVEVAGRSGGDAARISAVLLPIGTRAEAVALAETVQQTSGLTSAPLEPMPRAALRRRITRALAAAAVTTAPLAVVFWPRGLLAALIAVPAVGLAFASYAALGWTRVGDIVVSRSGVLVRRTAWTKVRRLQSAAVHQTPLQRWANLATLRLHIARAGGGPGDPLLIDVAKDVADTQLRRLTADAISRTTGPSPAGP